jgi:hypothetical protein
MIYICPSIGIHAKSVDYQFSSGFKVFQKLLRQFGRDMSGFQPGHIRLSS